jgi:hypothetical protein
MVRNLAGVRSESKKMKPDLLGCCEIEEEIKSPRISETSGTKMIQEDFSKLAYRELAGGSGLGASWST